MRVQLMQEHFIEIRSTFYKMNPEIESLVRQIIQEHYEEDWEIVEHPEISSYSHQLIFDLAWKYGKYYLIETIKQNLPLICQWIVHFSSVEASSALLISKLVWHISFMLS